MPISNSSAFINVGGRNLEYRRIAAAADGPILVFLHEGLGSISQWRDFPDSIAAATGLPAIIYARYGHGQSNVLQQAHGVDFMHREALEMLTEHARWFAPLVTHTRPMEQIAEAFAIAHDYTDGVGKMVVKP